jgi:putrescine aminotransferase
LKTIREVPMDLQKKDIIAMYADHVSPGRVDTYRKYDIFLVPDKRNGCFLYDVDGKRYVNCHCNGGVFNLGHRNRDIINAVTTAMRRFDIGNHHLISEPKALLGEMLARSMPGKLNQVVYGVSGGEAIDLAIKLARGVTGRSGIISARGGYHGHTGFALAAGDKKFREKFKPMPPGFKQVPFDDFNALQRTVSKKTAAVIYETIPATLGIPVPHEGFFKKVKKLCEQQGALLIIDEVQTGFGRTGKLWGFENFEVIPDIAVLGKGMSGGIYPISATVYNEKYAYFFREDPFLHISTCGGSDIGCFAAMEVIKISREKDFLNNVRGMGRYLRKGLEELGERYPQLRLRVRGIGLMMGLEFKDEITSLFLVKLLFDNGVFVVYSANDPRVIQFLPPLIISEREARFILGRVEKAFKAMGAQGG